MVTLSVCPRCGGNLFVDRSPDEGELFCLQCGYRYSPGRQPGLPPIGAVPAPPPEKNSRGGRKPKWA